VRGHPGGWMVRQGQPTTVTSIENKQVAPQLNSFVLIISI